MINSLFYPLAFNGNSFQFYLTFFFIVLQICYYFHWAQSWVHPIAKIPRSRGSRCRSAICVDVSQSKSRHWARFPKQSIQVHCHANEQTILSTCHQPATPILAKLLVGDKKINHHGSYRFHIDSSLFHAWFFTPVRNQWQLSVLGRCEDTFSIRPFLRQNPHFSKSIVFIRYVAYQEKESRK